MSAPCVAVGRSFLIVGILLVTLALICTFMLIRPSFAQVKITPSNAGEFLGFFGTVCGSVGYVTEYPKEKLFRLDLSLTILTMRGSPLWCPHALANLLAKTTRQSESVSREL